MTGHLYTQNSQQLVKSIFFVVKICLVFVVFEVQFLEFGDGFDHIISELILSNMVKYYGLLFWAVLLAEILCHPVMKELVYFLLSSTYKYYLENCAMPVTSHLCKYYKCYQYRPGFNYNEVAFGHDISKLYSGIVYCWQPFWVGIIN